VLARGWVLFARTVPRSSVGRAPMAATRPRTIRECSSVSATQRGLTKSASNGRAGIAESGPNVPVDRYTTLKEGDGR
jgi:hypothetical protein